MPRKIEGIACPKCGNQTSKVVDSRPYEGRKKRRRICKFGHKYSTVELVVGTIRDNKDNVKLCSIPRDDVNDLEEAQIETIRQGEPND